LSTAHAQLCDWRSFNVNTTVVDKRYFQGLPSPAAAALVAGFIWLMTETGR
jgi:CDP-diacylglycerol--serine O-phosphatidyltransferase